MVAIIKKIRNFPSWDRLAVLAVSAVCVCAMNAAQLKASAHCYEVESCLNTDNGEENGSMFSVIGYSFSGEYLIITYNIRYPGMTKVKLFDASQQLLWRSQYVDDEEGEHRLVLRRNVLVSGQYTFEFDYKNQKKTLNVSI